jgi:hypothetical protein
MRRKRLQDCWKMAMFELPTGALLVNGAGVPRSAACNAVG